MTTYILDKKHLKTKTLVLTIVSLYIILIGTSRLFPTLFTPIGEILCNGEFLVANRYDQLSNTIRVTNECTNNNGKEDLTLEIMFASSGLFLVFFIIVIEIIQLSRRKKKT